MSNKTKSIFGYKVFNPDFTCKHFKFEVGETYTHEGEISICNSGFHFCLKASDCFSYYSFDSDNIVCEVEAIGETQTHADDSKICTNKIKIIRQLTWAEVLQVANSGANNTGHSNSGNRNSGDSNSGYSNSGNSNSGDSNSGYRNSGDSNSGDSNSGYSNSGNRNSGDSNSGNRNSGDSNSGYRNSGAFCNDQDPKISLFNKPCKNMTVREWERSDAAYILTRLDLTMWIDSAMMNDKEKEQYPKHETTGGYLRTITMKEAWANLWHNLSEEKKKVFTSLENFSAEIFEDITGIKV